MPSTMPAPAAGLVLAAGKGTRMKSELPKVMHPICGLPMAEWVGRAMKSAGVARPVMVIGHGGELLQEKLGASYEYVWQRDQLGTGHAALQAAELIAGSSGPVIIAPNHFSFMDHFFVARFTKRRVRFMAKSQIFKPPMV